MAGFDATSTQHRIRSVSDCSQRMSPGLEAASGEDPTAGSRRATSTESPIENAGMPAGTVPTRVNRSGSMPPGSNESSFRSSTHDHRDSMHVAMSRKTTFESRSNPVDFNNAAGKTSTLASTSMGMPRTQSGSTPPSATLVAALCDVRIVAVTTDGSSGDGLRYGATDLVMRGYPRLLP